MKKMKNLLAMILCLLMVITCAVPAYAESEVPENGEAAEDISLDEPLEGETEEGEVSGSAGDCLVSVSGKIPENAELSLTDVEIDADEFGIEETEDIIASLDIKLLDGDAEWQPSEGESVTITLDASALGMSDGDEFIIYHQHEGQITVSDVYTVADGLLTFESNGFSIYAVVGPYVNGDNYNNYKIVMTVGDTMQVSTTTTGSSYTWSIVDGDAGSFTLASDNQKTATIQATNTGEITLKCVITSGGQGVGNKPGGQGQQTTTETMKVVALKSVGNSKDDIIFATIGKDYTNTDDKEYVASYGPYVMKIKFEDTDGKVLNNVNAQDYYVFDSAKAIDINTFSASAPDGYTYAGAYFYWNNHFSGQKVYVTSVDRVSNSNDGSYLWYSGTHDTSGAGRWYYQASGVLHIVYAPVDDVYTVIFKDHCEYELANYALNHNDGGVKFPEKYTDNFDNIATSLINNHHSTHDPSYTFNGNWVVTGGSNGIDGTYTTEKLKESIVNWNITSNITITAQCSEPEVTINYEVVGPQGCGTVALERETVKVYSGNARGSTATANANYKFVGWYADESCTGTALSTNANYIPTKPDTGWKEATYYAKFEPAVADLTIKKTGADEIDEYQSFIFTITGPDDFSMDVVITGNGSVTIQDLPIGTYTVTEKTGWSWRYEPENNSQSITLTAESENAVTFKNTRKKNQWLSNSSAKENQFKISNAEND